MTTDDTNIHAFPAVILAGGASRRMGDDKANIILCGRTLLAHALDRLSMQASPVVISRPDENKDCAFHAPVIADVITGYQGPLAGILSALMHFANTGSAASHMLSVPVDTPFFPLDLAEKLGAQAKPDHIVIAGSAGRVHPVFALWPLNLRASLKDWLSSQTNRKLMTFIESHAHHSVDFVPFETPAGAVDPFFNINTTDDLAEAQVLAQALLR